MFTNSEFAELIGSSMGFVFEAEGHKKIYGTRDTIWNEYVETEIRTHKSDYCILNTGHAENLNDDATIIMRKEDVLKCIEFYDKCKVNCSAYGCF